MIRPLKFRAWVKMPTEQWHYEEFELTPGEENYIEDGAALEQFTGLLDKTGKEIYEGDIVQTFWGSKHSSDENGTLGLSSVEYSPERGSFRTINTSRTNDWVLSKFQIKEYGLEVIGNIHENPELLK